MKENVLKITINRNITDVFDFSTNPRNTHLWFESIKEEVASESPPRFGTVYKNRGEDKSKWNEVVVSAFEKNKLFQLSCLNYNVRYTYKSLGGGAQN